MTPRKRVGSANVAGVDCACYNVEERGDYYVVVAFGEAPPDQPLGERFRLLVPTDADWEALTLAAIQHGTKGHEGSAHRTLPPANEWEPRMGYRARFINVGDGNVELYVRALLSDNATDGTLVLRETHCEGDPLEAIAAKACEEHAVRQGNGRHLEDHVDLVATETAEMSNLDIPLDLEDVPDFGSAPEEPLAANIPGDFAYPSEHRNDDVPEFDVDLPDLGNQTTKPAIAQDDPAALQNPAIPKRILRKRAPCSGYQKLECPGCRAVLRMTWRHIKKGAPYCATCSDVASGLMVQFQMQEEP